ncbi:hypothetical protein [Nitratifractor sp.]
MNSICGLLGISGFGFRIKPVIFQSTQCVKKGYPMLFHKIEAVTILIGAALIFPGCSDKNDQELYRTVRNDSNRFHALQNTEKATFRTGTDDEVLVLVSYLPDRGDEYEEFILAGIPKKTIATIILNNSRLNGRPPLSSRALSTKQLPVGLRGNIPPWFAIYKVRYPKIREKKLSLFLQLEGEKKTLFFYKIPKYLVK